MIRHIFSLLGFVPRWSIPLGQTPAPMVRQGCVSGVRAAKRLALKKRNSRKGRHAR